MMSIRDIVKAKNMDLLMHKHNNNIAEIHKKKMLVDEKEIRQAKISYENLLARLDTDKNTIKKDGTYTYNIPIDAKKLVGVSNNKPTINIRNNNILGEF